MTQAHQQLQTLFQRQQSLCCELQDTAKSITIALRDGDFAALEDRLQLEEKNLSALSDAGKALGELLVQAGYPSGKDGLKAYLAANDANGALTEQWQRLRGDLLRCRELNRGNGILARQGQVHTQATLAVLAGSKRHEASLYDASGAAQSGIGGRDLGSA